MSRQYGSLSSGKSLIESKSFWCSLVSIGAGVITLVTENSDVIVDTASKAAAYGLLGPHGLAITAIVGGLVSALGRITAKEEIISVLPKK